MKLELQLWKVMGTAPIKAYSENQQGSTSSITSGYSSTKSEKDSRDTFSTNEQLTTARKQPDMAAIQHPRLQPRPSVLLRSLSKHYIEDDLKLESEVVKRTPALKQVFKGFEECKKFLEDKSKKDSQYFGQLNKLLNSKVVEMFTKHGSDEQRTVMGHNLARHGFVEVVVSYYNYVIDDEDILAVTNPFVDEAHEKKDSGSLLVLTIREILWNFSDSSQRFSEKISDTDIFEKLVNDLESVFDDGLEELEEDPDMFAFSSAVGILHNCARNPDIDKDKFREAKAIDNLLPFLQSNLVYVKIITLLALGNMITEDQVDKLAAGTDVIDFLLEAMKKALKSSDRKEHGFHLSELVDGLASLAQSDNNKGLIMDKEPLPLILEILGEKDSAEVLAAVKLVWELAFLESNKQQILKDKGIMSTMEKLQSDKNTNINLRNAARSAWFVIAGKDKRIEVEMNKGLVQSVKDLDRPSGKHIMFSYNWGDKEMVLKIYQILKSEGLPIWIDINEMNKYSNLLEGMAQAVENAYVILICFSEKYKNSQNCRTEADYSFVRKKEFIPLKMQQGYSPDGWLGALIGARLFIEFTQKYPFDVKFAELKSTLPPRPKPDQAIQNPKPDPFVSQQTPVKSQQTSVQPTSLVPRKVVDWKKHDIDHWAAEYKLDGRAYNKVKQLSGEQLDFVFQVMHKSPDTFFRWAESKLGLSSIEEIMRFNAAVQGLMHNL